MLEKNNIKNVRIYKNAIRVLIGAISIGSAIGVKHFNSNQPITISSGVYNDLELDDDFVTGDYFTLKDTSLIDNRIDLTINRENLETIREIKLMTATTDFNDLKYMPNLESITLYQFGYLNNQEKEIISNLRNLKNITIILDDSIYSKECKDLSWIDSKVSINIVGSLGLRRFLAHDESDIDNMLTYYYLKDLNDLNNNRINITVESNDSIDNLERWHDELINIVESFGFDENTTDEEKIIKIIDYVTKNIDYDPKVSYASKNDAWDEETKELETYYNTKLISSVIDGNNEYGICCNYSALTTILAYYSDLDINWTVDDSHGWCSYEKDNVLYTIDPTYLDNSKAYEELNKNYNINPTKENRIALLDKIFMNKEYKHQAKNVFDYDKDLSNENSFNKNVKYINTGAEVYAERQTRKARIEYGILTLATLLALATNEYLSKKANNKEM